jgi:hypothetical protein
MRHDASSIVVAKCLSERGSQILGARLGLAHEEDAGLALHALDVLLRTGRRFSIRSQVSQFVCGSLVGRFVAVALGPEIPNFDVYSLVRAPMAFAVVAQTFYLRIELLMQIFIAVSLGA